MPENRATPHLEHAHDRAAIRARMAGDGGGPGYLSHGVLGAMDGSITTFTIVAGAVGGGLTGSVVVVLGLAKVVADALSMAVSNYFSTRSEAQEVERAWAMEERHVEQAPAGEREELRQILRGKGLSGRTLEDAVAAVTADRRAWIDTMVKEELHLGTATADPPRAALATFLAFLAVGLVPLLPFLFLADHPSPAFAISAGITALAFVAVGLVRGRALQLPSWRSALETLLTGTAAALVAYGIGAWLRQGQGLS